MLVHLFADAIQKVGMPSRYLRSDTAGAKLRVRLSAHVSRVRPYCFTLRPAVRNIDQLAAGPLCLNRA